MLTVPTSRPSTPWYFQPRVRTWLETLFRLTSRKRSYTLLLRDGDGLAWVMPQRRLVYVTTKLPDVPQDARFDPVDEHERRTRLLQALTSHEAAHVRFSGPKPSGKVGHLWNALEDERIERLLAREFPELSRAFTFLGDVVSLRARFSWTGSALEGCLWWRFEHDRDTPLWQPSAVEAERWEIIRPLVEAAWGAASSDEVEDLARQILGVLGEAESEALPESWEGQLSASGAGQEHEDAGPSTGAAAGALPHAPRPDSPAPVPLAPGVEGYARQLAPLLRPPERPGRSVPHRTRGRFEYDRHARGSDRPFVRREMPSRPVEVMVDVLVDTSGSMSGEPLACALSGALMVVRAAALCGSGARVTTFDTRPTEVVPVGASFEADRAALAAVTCGGGTFLAPSLAHVLAHSAGRDIVRLVVVICDGALDEDDFERCAGLVKDARAGGVRFAPLLIGEATRDPARWRAAFGTALPCADVAGLAKTLKAVLTGLRARLP